MRALMFLQILIGVSVLAAAIPDDEHHVLNKVRETERTPL
jgi:hypothetical protein